MAVLERRVQVLFDPEQFERLERLASRERTSVAAIIRDSVEERLVRGQSSKKAALARLLAGVGETDPVIEDWERVKDGFEREHLGDIG
jgi:predicted transcriptional regulator